MGSRPRQSEITEFLKRILQGWMYCNPVDGCIGKEVLIQTIETISTSPCNPLMSFGVPKTEVF